MRSRSPIILAWRLWKVDGLGQFDVFPFVERAAAFLVRLCAGDPAGALGGERGLLALDAGGGDRGLVCAADIARAYKATELGELPGDVCGLD